MNQKIIEMAREAGLGLFIQYEKGRPREALERFYRLARQDMQEQCAKVCEDSVPTYVKNGERWLKGQNGKPDVRLKEIAPNLEAAWEAEQLLKNGSVLESYSVQHQCAAAIRAIGDKE